MARKSLKLFWLAFALLVPLGLVIPLVLMRPFNLISRVIILLSPYRKLLPYLVAQAKHETDNFKSNIYKSHNNLFGMKHPSQRPSVGVKGDPAPEGGNYQKYSSEMQGVRDQLLYLAYVKFPMAVSSTKEYVDALAARGYFGRNPSQTAYNIYLGGVNHYLA